MHSIEIDPLIPVDRWPGIRVSYRYRGPAGAPVLCIQFRLDANRYQPEPGTAALSGEPVPDALPEWRQRAIRDEQMLDVVAAQIGADGSSSRPPVTISVSRALPGDAEMPLDDLSRAALRAFIAESLRHVAARASAREAEPVQDCAIYLPGGFPMSGDVMPLGVSITLARPDATADPARPEIGFGARVTSIVPPFSDGAGVGGLRSFIDDFEAAFVAGTSRLRVGASGDGDNLELWCIRLGEKAGEGIAFEIGTEPGFFALAPFDVISGVRIASIRPYVSGERFGAGAASTHTFTDVDLSRWRDAVLAGLDKQLAPARADRLSMLDRLLFDHPETEGYLPRLRAHASKLADVLAASIVPLFLEEISGSARFMAPEGARLAYRRRIGNAGVPGTAVALPVIDARAASSRSSSDADIRLVGTVRGSGSGQGNPGVIALTASEGIDGACLGFLCTFSPDPIRTREPRTLSFALEGVEIIREGASIAISLAGAPVVMPIGDAPITIPIPLGFAPAPPVLLECVISPVTRGANARRVSFHDLALYSCSIDYDGGTAAQDLCEVTVSRERWSAPLSEDVVSARLFETLVQYVAVEAAVLEDLSETLAALTPDSVRADAIHAGYAIEAFERVLGDAVEALRLEPVWTRSGLPEELPEGAHRFTVRLRDDAAAACVDLFSLAGPDAPEPAPTPLLLIDAGAYEPVPVTAAEGAIASYRYRAADGTFLDYATARASGARRLVLSGFDFAQWPSLSVAARILRNRELLAEMVTAPPFLMSSPVAGQVMTPLLSYDRIDLGKGVETPTPLSVCLDTFLGEFCAGGGAFVLALEGSYSYDVAGMRLSLPVVLLPEQRFTLPAESPLPFLVGIERSVQSWLAMTSEGERNGELSFDMQISVAGAEESLPQAMIADLFIDLEKLKWE